MISYIHTTYELNIAIVEKGIETAILVFPVGQSNKALPT